MSRPALLVTGIFYTALGAVLLLTPAHHLTIARSTFESFANSVVTKDALGFLLFLAGIETLAATYWYDGSKLRIAAAALRAGSMGAVLLLVLLVWLFLPTGSLTAVIIFGYLFALTLLTLPPPIEPIDAAIHLVQQRQQSTEQETTEG